MKETKKHFQSSLCLSEIVLFALLHTLKGVGNSAFYHQACSWQGFGYWSQPQQ
ncbi:MAG: hypothetical protein WBI40_12440 [Methylococcaceae bacterium]